MDFELTPEQEKIRAIARDFARDEVRPSARVHDLHPDPKDCHMHDVLLRADELGLRTMKIPRRYGGLEVDSLTEVLVLEELCIGDVGFGMTIQHSWREGYALAAASTESQRERYLDDFLSNADYLTALAMSEPECGSDTSAGYADDLQAGPRTSAVLDGDVWVLNGVKRWITNGNLADMYFVICRTDKTVPWDEGISVFLVPKGTPGLSVGKTEDKLGVRTNVNAEVYLEDATIPRDNLLGEVNRGREFQRRISTGSKAKTAGKSLGVAVAAYEELVGLVVDSGVEPDQEIDDALAVMHIEIEATRSVMWRAGWAVDNRPSEAPKLEHAAFIKASNVAVQATTLALELFPQECLVRGTHLDKLVRDAATMMHAGAGKHAMRARLGRTLRAEVADLLP